MMIPTLWNENSTAALVNHLWQSTAVVGVAWLLTLALRKNHAQARYWVWFAATVKFLLPFSLLIAAGDWLRSWIPAPPVQHAVANVVEQVAQPFAQMPMFAQAPMFDGTAAPIAAHGTNWLPVALLAIWACGALVVAARFARGWWTAYAAKRAGRPMNAGRPMDIAADIPVLCIPRSMEPGIFGIFRPVLLLPEGIISRLTPEQLRAVLAHEMSHVRRRDNFTYAIHMIVETLFWFHPAVWWIGARLIDERERACDEAVMQAGGAAETYAESILGVCKFCVESPSACVSGVMGADLKKRVVRIMSEQIGRKLSRGRKLTLAVVALVAMFGPLLVGMIDAPPSFAGQSTPHAQDMTGQWQGTLKLQQDHSVILVIAKENGALKGTMYEYVTEAQGALPLRASSISLAGSTFKFALDPIGLTYEGKLSADGNTITGTWTQGPTPNPLVLVRANKTEAWGIPGPLRQKMMPADADPSFELATIKPNDSGAIRMNLAWKGPDIATTASSLEDLIVFAYNVNSRQIVGGRSWMSSERYDIVAVPRRADVYTQPSLEQLRIMFRKLLADRFQLKFHKETRDMSAFVLTVDKGGAKIAHTQFIGPMFGCGTRPATGGLTLMVSNSTIPDFTSCLQSEVLDRPVVDHTGLQGKYDLTLTFLPDETQFNGHSPIGKLANDVEPAPSLSDAMQRQLGLKLSSEKTAVEVIAIDHVEKPSPN